MSCDSISPLAPYTVFVTRNENRDKSVLLSENLCVSGVNDKIPPSLKNACGTAFAPTFNVLSGGQINSYVSVFPSASHSLFVGFNVVVITVSSTAQK